MAGCAVLRFDKENKQNDYQCIAEGLDGKLHIGWIVVEKPWYTPKSSWTYWMYSNRYEAGGMCGGCIDLGLERVQVKPETIKSFTQIEDIKYCLATGLEVELVDACCNIFDEQHDVIARINCEDEIPYELWK